jgi:uncharacterized OsmC-like protein
MIDIQCFYQIFAKQQTACSMTSIVKYIGDLRTECTHLQSGQIIITDAPVDNQGKGEAFSPTDLTATSLATCILTTMGIRCRSLEIDISGAYAEVTKVMASDPRRIRQIVIKITMPQNDFTDVQKQILEKMAHTCPVAISLSENVEQVVDIQW